MASQAGQENLTMPEDKSILVTPYITLLQLSLLSSYHLITAGWRTKSPCYKETQLINSFCGMDTCGKNTLLLCIGFYSLRYSFLVSYLTPVIYGTVGVKHEALITYEGDCVSEGSTEEPG